MNLKSETKQGRSRTTKQLTFIRFKLETLKKKKKKSRQNQSTKPNCSIKKIDDYINFIMITHYDNKNIKKCINILSPKKQK